MPAHGDSYIISGTFPSRSKQSPTLWDNGGTHGTAIASVYDRIWHPGDPMVKTAYKTPGDHGRGISLPHNKITHYMHGICWGTNPESEVYAGAAMAVLDITALSFPYWFVFDHYYHVDPDWDFAGSSPGDYNFKRLGWGDDGYPLAGNYNYIDFEAGTFDGPTTKPLRFNTNTNSGGFVADGDSTVLSETMNANPCEGWLKESYCVKASDTVGGGSLFMYSDQGGVGWKRLYNLTTNVRWDTMAGTTRSINPNGTPFVRDRSADNIVYNADIYVDIDTTPARIYLTNHATFSSSTIFEVQPYTAWDTDEVTITVNQGKLSDGTVHVHLIDEQDGDEYLGTITLGAGEDYTTYSCAERWLNCYFTDPTGVTHCA